MLFNTHSDLRDKHALLSPSNYHWINYNDQKMLARYTAFNAARRGSDLHALAHECIRLGVKLSRTNKSLSTYVNDGITYKMTTEPTLFYSYNCFGTPDTISFRRGKLRVHDLKTGITQTSEHQLEVYAALFCLEYNVSPFDIEVELRIYQRDQIRFFIPPPELIEDIMEKIVYFDNQIEMYKNSDRF
jgi:hypothetical protein